VETLHKARVPCGPVLDKTQVNEHPQLRARDMLARVSHPRLGALSIPGCPIRLTESACQVGDGCADLGAHTEEVLRDILHLSEEEIAGLKRKEAV
jgi:CoA:oxalate CoA-transferase